MQSAAFTVDSGDFDIVPAVAAPPPPALTTPGPLLRLGPSHSFLVQAAPLTPAASGSAPSPTVGGGLSLPSSPPDHAVAFDVSSGSPSLSNTLGSPGVPLSGSLGVGFFSPQDPAITDTTMPRAHPQRVVMLPQESVTTAAAPDAPFASATSGYTIVPPSGQSRGVMPNSFSLTQAQALPPFTRRALGGRQPPLSPRERGPGAHAADDGPSEGSAAVISGRGGTAPDDHGPKQLIVNYLAAAVAPKELLDVFEHFGPVVVVRIMRSRGYGFVYFEKSTDAAAAVSALSGLPLYGKRIRVSFADPQRPLPRTATLQLPHHVPQGGMALPAVAHPGLSPTLPAAPASAANELGQ